MNSVQVRRYTDNAGSDLHLDAFSFSNEIPVLSLGGDGVILFRNPHTGEELRHVAKRRSLYVMAGDARLLWQHSVLPVPHGVLRYSIVIRTSHDYGEPRARQ